MTTATITKIENQTITLPKAWKGRRVLLRITDNIATITRISASPNVLSAMEINLLQKLGKNISPQTVKKALAK